ncbi:hypothetical protein O9992_01005 [Vibrio lentus]|nr:hypothetical protein [Vibrio lentus]
MILCVALFGFGTFAGFVTLTFATIGFLVKLSPDEIEAIGPSPTHHRNARNGCELVTTGELRDSAQVLPRFIEFRCTDSTSTSVESAVIGIVGAGGIGATLNTAMDRYE